MKIFKLKSFCLFIMALFVSIHVGAVNMKPVIVYSGDPLDSFHGPVFEGADKFTSETGVEVGSVLISPFESISIAGVKKLHQVILNDYDPIIVVGFVLKTATRKMASLFPDRKFILLDGSVDLPNVQSINFKEHEGSFIVGILAAMASKTNRVGFIGGMDSPLIGKFACGYKQGVDYAGLKTVVIEDMIGKTPAAWQEPKKGYDLAKKQIQDEQVDVVYQVAGNSGLGVLEVASELEKLSIGVDSNQNSFYPGGVLTSMLKSLDVAVYESLISVYNNSWKGGTVVMGLKEDGIGWALDEHNEDLITEAMKVKVQKAGDAIINGSLVVSEQCD